MTRFLVLLALPCLVGCVAMRGADTVTYEAGDPELAEASVENGVWESAPWSAPDAPWLDYPAQTTLDFPHTLGRAPRVVLVYLSFDPLGTASALAAGDLSRVVSVDAERLSIRNETGADFYARVVAF